MDAQKTPNATLSAGTDDVKRENTCSLHHERRQDEVAPLPPAKELDWKAHKTSSNNRTQATLLAALETGGLLSLGMEVLNMEAQLSANWGYFKFNSKAMTMIKLPYRGSLSEQEAHVQFITGLACMSTETIKHILKGTFGKTAATDPDSMKLPLKYLEKEYEDDKFTCIYAMIIQNDAGKRPKVSEVREVLSAIEEYCDLTMDDNINMRNSEAHLINSELGPGGDRSWVAIPSDEEKWKYFKDEKLERKEVPNPRRYYSTTMSERFKEFVATCRKQMEDMGSEEAEYLPITYVGWSSVGRDRKKMNYAHSASGNKLALLFEIIIYMKMKERGYLAQFFPVMHVSNVDLIRSEHLVSILFGSYTIHGGFNLKAGGETSDRMQAEKDVKEHHWKASRQRLAEQGVFKAQLAILRPQIEEDLKYAHFPEQYRKNQKVIETQQQKLKRLEEDLADTTDQCVDQIKIRLGQLHLDRALARTVSDAIYELSLLNIWLAMETMTQEEFKSKMAEHVQIVQNHERYRKRFDATSTQVPTPNAQHSDTHSPTPAIQHHTPTSPNRNQTTTAESPKSSHGSPIGESIELPSDNN